MCVISSIALGALAIGSTVAGYVGQSQAAEAQAEFQNRQYSETARLAEENYKRQAQQIATAQEQNREVMIQQGTQNAIAAQQARASAGVAAGEAGVSGASVYALMQDFNAQEAANRFSLQQNLGWSEEQARQEMEGARAEAQGRISGATPGPVRTPSLLAAGLQIGASALGTYDDASRKSMSGVYNPNNRPSGFDRFMNRRLF